MTNLFKNSSFENGWHHDPYGIAEIQIPNDWEFEWTTGLPNDDDPASTPFGQPEANVKSRAQIPDSEEDDFFLDGQWTYKVFGAWRPIHFKLRQRVNLTQGEYTVVVPVFFDLYNSKDASGNKVGAADPKSGQLRVVVNGEPSPWQYGGGPNVLQLKNYALDFDILSTSQATIEIEFKLPHPLKSNGIFTDGVSLVRTGDIVDPPTPEDCRGKPRAQYKRIYVLLPQGLDAAWRQAVDAVATAQEWTVGTSADDAGLGDLDDRNIITVNASQIGTGLTQGWFDEHYSGARIIHSIEATTPSEAERKLREYVEGKPPPPPPPPDDKFALVTLHLQTEDDGWLDFIEILCDRGTPPAAVKFVGGFESSRKVKAIDPTITTIARFYDSNQGRWTAGDPRAAAVGYTAQFKDAIDNNPIDYVSSLNETIATDNLETIRKHVAFDVAWVPYVRELWGGEVGSISLEIAVGNPREGQQTEMLRPVAYEAVKASENALVRSLIGYHSYWWGAPSAASLMTAGVTSYRGRSLSDYSIFTAPDVRPVIVQPNVLRALRANDNKRAADWTRRFFEAEYPAFASKTQAIQYESGLESWWKWHAGRAHETWGPCFAEVGLYPGFALTEIGVVGTPDRGPTLFASAGWRDSICYGANWSLYETDLIRWQQLIRSYPFFTLCGTIFTVGADFVGWDKFKLKKEQMIRLAQVL